MNQLRFKLVKEEIYKLKKEKFENNEFIRLFEEKNEQIDKQIEIYVNEILENKEEQ